MKKRMDKKTMKLIRESQKFGIDDRLSDVLPDAPVELSAAELELVAAAAGPDYSKFKDLLDSKK
ncbi:MAG: hypothetical protein IKH13_09655 [Clostridia bacterium]|nr:hypothetical protein [Clostridia bacterium]